MELFVIPTHRKCTQAIESLVKEIEYYELRMNRKTAIVCNGDDKSKN